MPLKEPKNASPWRQVGLVFSVVFTIPVATAAGGLLGHWIDSKLDADPLFTLLLLGAGFVAGVREVLREVKRFNRS